MTTTDLFGTHWLLDALVAAGRTIFLAQPASPLEEKELVLRVIGGSSRDGGVVRGADGLQTGLQLVLRRPACHLVEAKQTHALQRAGMVVSARQAASRPVAYDSATTRFGCVFG